MLSALGISIKNPLTFLKNPLSFIMDFFLFPELKQKCLPETYLKQSKRAQCLRANLY
jgi:hypothetical protein